MVSLDGGFSKQASAQGILHILNKFVEAPPGAFAFGSLREARRAMLAEAGEWSSRIRRTISDGQFFLAFQPIVDMTYRRFS